jgi:hypothetical protein
MPGRGALKPIPHAAIVGDGTVRAAADAAGTEPMNHANIARAIGPTLREEYASMLKEALPAQLADLLLRLEQATRSEAADSAQKFPHPIGVRPA